ncbi:MAG: ferric reductase-like transmembrane domain-containing protein [Streptosporangiaceae bacterium]|jgi:DMSO/TMAO reductase YedYZ heme-binding membrane subunit
MARNTAGRRPGPPPTASDYRSGPNAAQGGYAPGPYPNAAVVDTRRAGRGPAGGPKPAERPDKNRFDAWMDQDFKFGRSRIKRQAVALILLGLPAVVPLFFMLPALITVNSATFASSVDDTLGTGAEINLFLCLLISPMVTLTGQRWFFPLRRWYGIMMAATSFGDAIAAGITDNFAGGVFGRLTGHVFELMGFMMAMLLIPLVITANPWAQRKLGKYWKTLHKLTYAVWGLLFCHLILLEGTGFERGDNGSGTFGDGDAIFHQRFYQYSACSLFLLTLRLPPVKRWIAARQAEGRNWLVWATILPIFALFVIGFTFIINEEIFKGLDSFNEHPSAE